MKKKLFMLTILFQVCIVVYLLIYILNINKTSKASISLIPKNTIIQSPSGELRHFFEPKANSKIVQKIDESTENGIATINNDSLNERYEYKVEKKDTFRIITLGDSFTYGLYVDTQDNWTEILEDLFARENRCPSKIKIEVINLGMTGYDIAYSMERFKLRGLKYKPDIVIWLLIDSDRLTDKIIQAEKDLKNKQENEKVKKSGLSRWFLANEFVVNNYTQNMINKFQFDELIRMSEMYSGNLIFLRQENYRKDNKFKYMYDFKQMRPKTYIHEIINIEKNDRLRLPADGHPNSEGHKAIAQDVYYYLIDNGLIPCKKYLLN